MPDWKRCEDDREGGISLIGSSSCNRCGYIVLWPYPDTCPNCDVMEALKKRAGTLLPLPLPAPPEEEK